MTLDLVIAPAAQDDIGHIYRYGLVNWGKKQAEAYMAHLEDVIWLMTEQSEIGTKRDELAKGLYGFPVKQHVVFYRIKADQLQIARILHGRQDPKRHTL